MKITVKNFIYFFIAVVVGKIVGAFSSFCYAKLLSPADYGAYLTLMLIYVYSPIICFGTLETLIKQFPFFKGIKDDLNAQLVERGVFGSILLSATLLIVAGVFFIFIPKGQLSLYTNQIMQMVIATIAGHISSFFYYRFTAHQEFKTVSLIDSMRSLFTFILVASGLNGAVVGFCLNELIMLSLSYFMSCKKLGKLKPLFDLKYIVALVKIGFPITIIWWFYMLQMSVNRIISIEMLGKEATGYLGFGQSIVSLLVLIPMALGRVL